MNKNENIQIIKEKIEWYKPSKKVSNVLLELGTMGFEFEGHGHFVNGEEVFQLSSKDIYVDICKVGRKIIVGIITLDKNDNVEKEFEGTIGDSFKWLEKRMEGE